MITYTGRYLLTDVTGSAFSSTIALSPLLLDARLVTVSDAYQEFRFTKVHVRITTGLTTVAETRALAFSPVVPTTQPTGSSAFQDMMNFTSFSCGCGLFGSPLPHLKLTRKQLCANGPKWFRRGTAFDDLLEVQGYVYAANQFSAYESFRMNVFIEYTVQLQAPANTGTTMRPAHAPQSVVDALARVRAEHPEEKWQDDVGEEEEPVDLTPLFRRDGMVVVPHMVPKGTTKVVQRKAP